MVMPAGDPAAWTICPVPTHTITQSVPFTFADAGVPAYLSEPVSENPGPGLVGGVPSSGTPPVLRRVLSGHWMAPVGGAIIGPRPTLTAWPTSSLTDVAITRVVFHAAWAGGAAEVCTATAGGADGLWSCTPDLGALGVPPGPVTLTFDVFDDAGDMTPAAATLAATLAKGRPKASWGKGTTKDASHVSFGDPVDLVARVSDSADVQEVRFTAYYPDWPNARDAAKFQGFDPKRTWRTVAVCRPKGVTGDVPITKGCTWDGDTRSTVVTYHWDPTTGESKRSVPGVPKADPAITTGSKACLPVTLGIDITDAVGYRASAPGGKFAGKCDAKADGLGRTAYLDPPEPPAAPSHVRIVGRGICVSDSGCGADYRMTWDAVPGATGYEVFVENLWMTGGAGCGDDHYGRLSPVSLEKVGPGTLFHKGRFTPEVRSGRLIYGGRYSVVAINDAGASARSVAHEPGYPSSGDIGWSDVPECP